MTGTSSKNPYRQLDIKNLPKLIEANSQLHHACQFLAIIGKNLIPQEPDDSNTNLGVIAGGLIGKRVNGPNPFHGYIDIPGFNLNLVDPQMNILWSTNIHNKSRDLILEELTSAVNDLNMEGSKLKHIDHYELEVDHPIQRGIAFDKPEEESLRTWHTLYSNAATILWEASSGLSKTHEIRIWPHHFDIGTYFPLDEDDTRSIGMGLAMPDTLVQDFYFYVYGWTKDFDIDISKFPSLSIGNWKWGDWNGALLPVTPLNSSENSNQKEEALKFFKESLHQYLKVLK